VFDALDYESSPEAVFELFDHAPAAPHDPTRRRPSSWRRGLSAELEP
jgi:hypothetical protein